MNSRLIQTLKFFLGWPLSILALIFLWQLFAKQTSSSTMHIKDVNYLFAVLSVLCFALYFLLRAVIFNTLLQYKNYRLPLAKSIYLWGTSELKRYIPGNIWSFLGRVVQFNKEQVPATTITKLLGVEIILILLSSALLSLLFMPRLYELLIVPVQYPVFYWAITLVVASLIGIFLFSSYIREASLLPKGILGICNEFNLEQKVTVLFMYIIAFILFGFGTYFGIVAITILPLDQIGLFIGLSVFSLLVGYVSILTPTGLGVREGVLTAGLLSNISVSLAAFVSIFSRILLIIGEVIFLLFITMLSRIKDSTSLRLEIKLLKNKHVYILVSLLTLYCAYFIVASFLRYNNYYTGRFDLGNMDQAVWNSSRGRFFQITDPNGTDIISRLAFHADFILVLLAPFYLIWSDPRMLLIIQTVVIACGGIFVYLLGNKIIKNKSISLALVFVYLVYPATNYVNLYDFHPVALAIMLLLGAFYFVTERKYLLTALFLLLACLTKEEIWLIAGLFGLYIFLVQKKRVLGGLITILGFVIFYYIVAILIPHVRGGEHFALSYYSDFGSSPSGIIKNIFLSPAKTLQTVTGQGQLRYLFQLFLPLGFISLVSPLYLLFAGPDLGIDLLSNNLQLHQIFYQYSAPITPFIFISSMYALAWLIKKNKDLDQIPIIAFLIGCSIVGAYYFGPLPGAKHANIDMFTKPLQNDEIIDDFVSNIPARYSIAATNNLGSHLSRRQKIFTIPVGIDKADVILFLLNDPFAQPSLEAQRKMVVNMERDPRYTEVYVVNDFVVFKKSGINLQRLPQNKFRNFLPILRRPRATGTPSPTE